MFFSGFFNGDTEYGQEELSRYFDNIYESGVSLDENGLPTLQVRRGDGEVTVTAGYAIIRGYYFYNDSDIHILVKPDTHYVRSDRVVLKLDVLDGSISVLLKQGTSASISTVPSLQRDGNIYELSLARLMVQPGNMSGSITVTDERLDAALCGVIRPKNLSEYKTMMEGNQKQWEEWFASQQGHGWRNIMIQPEEPGEAVAGSIWIQT